MIYYKIQHCGYTDETAWFDVKEPEKPFVGNENGYKAIERCRFLQMATGIKHRVIRIDEVVYFTPGEYDV